MQMSNAMSQKNEQERDNMILRQIRSWGVHNHEILSLFKKVPREKFVAEESKDYAFSEIRIPLGHEQKMLFPAIEGRILEETSPCNQDDVLLVGTGSGYLATCFAHLAKSVVSIDKYDDFTQTAIRNSQAFGLSNLHFITQDIKAPIEVKKQYSIIVFTGSFKTLPSLYAEILKEHGRIFIFEGNTTDLVSAVVYTKTTKGMTRNALFETSLERLEGFEDKAEFVF